MISFSNYQGEWPDAKLRRDEMRAAGRCINGTLDGSVSKRHGIVHGAVVKGGKCQRCQDVARASR